MSEPVRVLVVDDEPHIVHVVRLKLQSAGFEVVTASNGREGLALASESPPDLVVTDYQMPLLSGLEMCAKLKEQASTSRVPAIMLTARGFSIPAQELEATNIREVLSKPFSPRDILSKVQALLETEATDNAEAA